MCAHFSISTQCQISFCYTGGFIYAGATYPCRANCLRVLVDGAYQVKHVLGLRWILENKKRLHSSRFSI